MIFPVDGEHVQLPMYYLIDANGIIRDKAFTADSINVSSINTIQ